MLILRGREFGDNSHGRHAASMNILCTLADQFGRNIGAVVQGVHFWEATICFRIKGCMYYVVPIIGLYNKVGNLVTCNMTIRLFLFLLSHVLNGVCMEIVHNNICGMKMTMSFNMNMNSWTREARSLSWTHEHIMQILTSKAITFTHHSNRPPCVIASCRVSDILVIISLSEIALCIDHFDIFIAAT